jgi:predicted NBD/HSP70 family sugar kinase
MRKATRQDLKHHNRLTLLRAVYDGTADNRAALAQVTGLAKPTVSDLIGELIAEGLLEESGHGESTEIGGKRPRLLAFVPASRQVIGVSLDTQRVMGVLSNLDGRVIAEHYALLDGASGDRVVTILSEVIGGLMAQLDAPLLCIGIGVPGVVDSEGSTVEHAAHLGWRNLPLGERLSAAFDCPVYVANDTELTALAHYAFGGQDIRSVHNLMTVLVNSTVEIGVAVQGTRYHHGGDIGGLRAALPTQHDRQPLETHLSWQAVQQRTLTLRADYPQTMLPETGLSYLHIRRAAAHDDALALALLDEIAGVLAEVVGWGIALLQPDYVALAGGIVDLGDLLLVRLRAKTRALLPPEQVERVTFSFAEGSNLSALGAVALAIHNELDIL